MLFISSEISAQKVFRELFRSILLKKNQQGYLEIVEEKGETFCKFGELLISVKCLQSELQTTMNYNELRKSWIRFLLFYNFNFMIVFRWQNVF